MELTLNQTHSYVAVSEQYYNVAVISTVCILSFVLVFINALFSPIVIYQEWNEQKLERLFNASFHVCTSVNGLVILPLNIVHLVSPNLFWSDPFCLFLCGMKIVLLATLYLHNLFFVIINCIYIVKPFAAKNILSVQVIIVFVMLSWLTSPILFTSLMAPYSIMNIHIKATCTMSRVPVYVLNVLLYGVLVPIFIIVRIVVTRMLFKMARQVTPTENLGQSQFRKCAKQCLTFLYNVLYCVLAELIPMAIVIIAIYYPRLFSEDLDTGLTLATFGGVSMIPITCMMLHNEKRAKVFRIFRQSTCCVK